MSDGRGAAYWRERAEEAADTHATRLATSLRRQRVWWAREQNEILESNGHAATRSEEPYQGKHGFAVVCVNCGSRGASVAHGDGGYSMRCGSEECGQVEEGV